MTSFKGSFPTPFGQITATIEGGKIIALQFGKKAPTKTRGPTCYLKAKKQILEYACGHRKKFQLPWRMEGTPFQVKVWNAIEKISFGEKRSYKELAGQINSPRAFRAVGGACHNNPLPLIIPCHRVVGANGNLTGFAGGVPLKKRLLQLEKSL